MWRALSIVVGLGGVLALSCCGSNGSETTASTTSTAATKAPLTHAEKRRKRLERNGEIATLEGGTGPSSIVMWPQTNGWEVCDPNRCTEVSAGAVAQDHSAGWFIIHRYRRPTAAKLPGGSVKIPGSGPVRIIEAPLGHKVMTSAQRHGSLRFRGKSGVTGTLHLKNDTVTITGG